MKAELIADANCALGEGPLWNSRERRIYWTDIDNGVIYRYDLLTGVTSEFFRGGVVGGFTLQYDGSLLLFMDRGAIRLLRDTVLSTIIEKIEGESEHRFNDVIADPVGCVFCGTIARSGNAAGRLFRLDSEGEVTPVLGDIGCSNGMGFSPDQGSMYYTDSGAGQIYVFDYDPATGNLSKQRLFAKVTQPGAVPDGLTVDSQGGVWSAMWGGSCVVHYSEMGVEQDRIDVGTSYVTSVTFGGDDLCDLYITTAGGYGPDNGKPGAGGLYCARPGVRGTEEFRSRIIV